MKYLRQDTFTKSFRGCKPNQQCAGFGGGPMADAGVQGHTSEQEVKVAQVFLTILGGWLARVSQETPAP